MRLGSISLQDKKTIWICARLSIFFSSHPLETRQCHKTRSFFSQFPTSFLQHTKNSLVFHSYMYFMHSNVHYHMTCLLALLSFFFHSPPPRSHLFSTFSLNILWFSGKWVQRKKAFCHQLVTRIIFISVVLRKTNFMI